LLSWFIGLSNDLLSVAAGIRFNSTGFPCCFLSADAEHVEILRRGPRLWRARAKSDQHAKSDERQMGVMNGGPINLASARLRRAQLRFATLSGADLTDANLCGADLTDARVRWRQSHHADLSNAVLARTDLAGAKLSGAGLGGANLLEARNLTQGQLDDALGDALTELPPHLTRPAFWMEREALSEPDLAIGVQNPPLPKVMARGGGTMSWLVGGAPTMQEAQKLK
jgi:hypothetical protein